MASLLGQFHRKCERYADKNDQTFEDFLHLPGDNELKSEKPGITRYSQVPL